MRVERCISARKSRIQTIRAEHISVFATSLFALAISFVSTLGAAVLRRRKQDEVLAYA